MAKKISEEKQEAERKKELLRTLRRGPDLDRFIRLSEGIHIGMRTYEKDPKNNCTLCDSSKVIDIVDNLYWSDENKAFFPFYSELYELINPENSIVKDYDEMVIRSRGIQYDVIEGWKEVERLLQLDMSYAIDCYKRWFDEEYSYPFVFEIKDSIEALKDVKSSRVNTLEMLFEAEELERVSIENDKKFSQEMTILSREAENETVIPIGNLSDPEDIIKLLKNKKGIY